MNKGVVPVITVIIPAYNCENYIDRCLNNLLKEKLNEVEIIVVNDGSCDRTLKKLESFSENITVISKPNGGVSSARNTGIESAHGKYITFLDADDEIPSGTLAEYLQLVKKKSEINLIQGCFNEPQNSKPTYVIDSIVIKKICLGYPRSLKDFPDIKYEVKEGVHGCYGKLYNLEIIKDNNLKFDETIGLGEDLLFYFDYLSVVKKVYILERQTYKIYNEPGSSTRRVNLKMPEYALEFSKKLLGKVEKADELYPEAMYQIGMHVNVAFSCCFGNPLNRDKNKMKKFKAFLKNEEIHGAYDFLAANEKTICKKAKYWMLKNQYVTFSCLLEKIYNRLVKGSS